MSFSRNKFVPIHFNIIENALYKSFTYVFSFVIGNDRGSSIGMTKKDMAASLANWFKTKVFQNREYFLGLRGTMRLILLFQFHVLQQNGLLEAEDVLFQDKARLLL